MTAPNASHTDNPTLGIALVIVGMLAIFVTALWGMWQNMNIGALGG